MLEASWHSIAALSDRAIEALLDWTKSAGVMTSSDSQSWEADQDDRAERDTSQAEACLELAKQLGSVSRAC
jgi:hypothetical protein